MLILLIAVARFFPVLARLMQAAAIGGRAYWWLILPALVISWASCRLLKRRSDAKKFGYQFEGQRIRDVTGSAEHKLE